MPIEIVDFPIKYGDFHSFLYVYQRVCWLGFHNINFILATWGQMQRGAGRKRAAAKIRFPLEKTIITDETNPCYTTGEQTKSYWKWSFIVDFPMKNGDFPLLC